MAVAGDGPGPADPGRVLTGPAHAVYSVAFAPGGTRLAAGSADGTVRLWDTQARAAAPGCVPAPASS